jgi:hypothetical protein
MWTKLDDALIDHRKIFAAGDLIGKNGTAIALGFYALGLMYTNKHLTDGHLTETVVKRWRNYVEQPLRVADVMVSSGLWDREPDGFRVHDFHHHNPRAADVHEHRQNLSEIRSRSGRAGGLKSGEARKQKASNHEPNA